MLTASTAMARTISWSGYTWDVRPAGTAQEPGPNDWSDSSANVQVSGSDLLLAIVKDSSGHWTSSEIDNQQHLGYGTYRWVVASDLSTLDANAVLGMFTYGGSDPSNNEIDIEPSHWGNMSWPTGSTTVWQNAAANQSVEKDFNYSSRPPYVNQFVWSPGRITYLITDAAGTVLLNWTLTSGVPTPSAEVPVINYWRFNNVAPVGVQTMRVSSFSWAPLGRQLPPVGSGSGGGGTVIPPPPLPAPTTPATSAPSLPVVSGTATGQPTGSGGSAAGTKPANADWSCTIGGRHQGHVRMSLRFAVASRGGRLIRWTATGAGRVRLVFGRLVQGNRFVTVGSLTRTVHAGSGTIRVPSKLGKRPLRAGAYDIRVTAGVSHVRCAPQRLLFTLLHS